MSVQVKSVKAIERIKTEKINEAVVTFTNQLEIGFGSGAGFDFYRLLQLYIQNSSFRIRANVLMDSFDYHLKT